MKLEAECNKSHIKSRAKTRVVLETDNGILFAFGKHLNFSTFEIVRMFYIKSTKQRLSG